MGIKLSRSVMITLTAGAVALWLAAPAAAASSGRVTVQDGTLRFDAGEGARNDVHITVRDTSVVLTDAASPLTVDAPCVQVSPSTAMCSTSVVRGLSITLGDLDDAVRNDTSLDADLLGDTGDDFLIGGSGSDQFDGGDGIDTVSYEDRLEPITATIDGVANDGRLTRVGIAPKCTAYTSEYDSIGSRNENLKAGEGNDNLGGTSNGEYLNGQAGNDTICGAGGDDTLVGGGGDDTIRGGSGDDDLFGNAGSDTLYGGTGAGDYGDCGENDGVADSPQADLESTEHC